MTSQNLVEIILQVLDKASAPLKQVDDKLKEVGDTASNANQKAQNATERYNQKINETKNRLAPLVDKVNDVGNKGSESFKKLSQAEQDSITKFHMLDEKTQTTLQALRELGVESMDLIPGADDAIAKLAEMDNRVHTFGGSFDYAKAKLELMGTSTDTLKGKLQTVGTGITTYIANKWDSVRSKVTGTANLIKSALGSALTTVRTKLDSLGNAFSGLGGIMSSVMGGIGLKELGDMTIGASITRDRIHSLSNALLQADTTMVKLNGTSVSLWDKMDADTNTSLVSLNQLSQSLSVVKQMTGATGNNLTSFENILLDVGQRAILMGKTGEDAMTVMQAAGKGLNGEFETLKENFGITKDKLESLGWSGSADDIEGYTAALKKALDESGDVSDMMDTTSGKLTSLKKMWSVAGQSIGNDFKPYLDQALTSLLKFLDANGDGALDKEGKNWLRYAYGVMAVGSAFATVAPSIAPALSVLDSMTGKTKSVLQFLGLMKTSEEALTATSFMNTIAIKLNTVGMEEHAAATVAAEMAEMGFVASLKAATVALLTNPWTWVIVALVALAVAVYEVGKSFGWWTDVQSMLAAVWAGINRLWSAFINHPDVQAALQAVGSALSWLGGKVMEAIQWVLKFFDINTSGGKWDIISTLIHGIGAAWNSLRPYIIGGINALQFAFGVLSGLVSTAAGIGQGIYNALKPIVCILLGCSPGIVPALQRVQEVFVAVWNAIIGWISGAISQVISAIQPILDVLHLVGDFLIGQFMESWNAFIIILTIVSNAVGVIISAFTRFLSGQISLQTMLITIWNVISTTYMTIFSIIIARVVSFATQFLTVIITYFSQLPGRVYNYLLKVYTHIVTQFTKYVTTAKTKVNQLVTSVVNYLKGLPGKVYSVLLAVVNNIRAAIQAWISAASQKVSDLISRITSPFSGVAGKISSALSGVANALLSPFKQAWAWIEPYVNQIKNALDIIPGGAGGEMAAGGMPESDLSKNQTLFDNNVNQAAVVANKSTNENTYNFNFDFKDVPENVDTDSIIDVILDPKVLRALTGDTNFQKYDLNVKSRLNKKARRSRGV